MNSPFAKKRNLRFIGVAVIGIGVSMSKNHINDALAGFIIVAGVALTIFPSLFMRKRKKKKDEKEDFLLTDDMIHRFATIKGGVLSITDLTTQTSLNPEEAKKRLEALHLSNKAELRITDSGNLLYDFREDCQLPDKKYGSKLILE